MLDEALSAFVTIFVTIDPPGLAPLFLALTAGMSRGQRMRIAMRASLTAFAILVLFAVAGTAILALFGITVHSFRIAASTSHSR
jgi:multiple antibiotic resistance protein